MVEEGRSEEQRRAAKRQTWVLLVPLTIGVFLLPVLVGQPEPGTDWSWSPIHNPHALRFYLLWPVLVIVFVLALRKAVQGYGVTSTEDPTTAGTVAWYAAKHGLRPAFVSKVVSAEDFDPTYRHQAWDQIPVEVFLAHIRRFEKDDWLTRSARTVHRITFAASTALVLLLVVVALWSLDSYLIVVGTVFCGISAYAWWLSRKNIPIAREADGIKNLALQLGERATPYPRIPEVLDLAKKVNLYWVSYPLGFLAMLPIGFALRMWVGEATKLLAAAMLAPLVVLRIGALKMQQRLEAYKLPD